MNASLPSPTSGDRIARVNIDGTIATAIGFSVGTWNKVLITTFAIGVMCALTWLSFVTGERVVRLLGPSFLTVITRLMGLILAVVGMQMFVEGFHEAGL